MKNYKRKRKEETSSIGEYEDQFKEDGDSGKTINQMHEIIPESFELNSLPCVKCLRTKHAAINSSHLVV